MFHVFLCSVVLRHNTLQPRCGRCQRLSRGFARFDCLMIGLRRLSSSMVLTHTQVATSP